ncbi:hypothetical protein WG66_002418 [Moniliophthora roreri]|nr:hypothetical protein WG66_002418 [Moniliophthora roreri]
MQALRRQLAVLTMNTRPENPDRHVTAQTSFERHPTLSNKSYHSSKSIQLASYGQKKHSKDSVFMLLCLKTHYNDRLVYWNMKKYENAYHFPEIEVPKQSGFSAIGRGGRAFNFDLGLEQYQQANTLSACS